LSCAAHQPPLLVWEPPLHASVLHLYARGWNLARWVCLLYHRAPCCSCCSTQPHLQQVMLLTPSFSCYISRCSAETASGKAEVKDHLLDDATDDLWGQLRHEHIAGAAWA
jgi:hypothetical protein